MKKPNLAVLGATGVVGREILSILEEQKVEFNEIKFLSSYRSAGSKLTFMGKEYIVEEAKPESFENVNIVLASAGGSTSLKLAPEAAKRGAVFIDNSSAFRMEKDVPLVIAGVNDDDLKKHKGIIANPNCSTSQLMLVLKPLNDYAKIKRLIVSTYQAVSGAGLAAINELTDNTKVNLIGMPYEPKAFKHEIGFNLIPQIDSFTENGYTKEEMKVTNETRKILHLDKSTPISCTAVRVPVYRGHSEAVTIEFEKEISPEKTRELLENAYGVKVYDDIDNYIYPTPKECAGKDPVYVGRIRKSIAFDNGIDLFCVADNLRIGAALNTVRLAMKVIEMGLY
ncbi:TPA: aspartate-semialdehyde dehydrogenase [Candidatus Galligastranaerophilus gallistercoris]|nr:aspartate-semialdehyde dehydrogenase [Candidatus Galligastranaerophilus gallistercoris]